jgi:hypothetical protein
MKILLVNPIKQEPGVFSQDLYPPIGLAQVSTYYKKKHYETELWDMQNDPKQRIDNIHKPDVVGINVMIGQPLITALELTNHCQKLGIPVIWGGPVARITPYLAPEYVDKDANYYNELPDYDVLDMSLYESAIYTSIGCLFKCLSGDTPVNTIDGNIKIKELVGKKTKVLSIDKDGNPGYYDTKLIAKTGINRELVRVLFDDNSYIDCTPDHRFLTFKNGNQASKTTEKETQAIDLIPGQSVRAIHSMKSRVLPEINHKVKRVYKLPFREDVYCLEVDGQPWFYANNVLVHNCSFCYHNQDRVMQYDSPEQVINHADLLHDRFGIKNFKVMDDNFFTKTDRAIETLKLFKKRKYRIKQVHSHINTIKPELYPYLKGIVGKIGMSIEHGNEDVRKNLFNKPMKEERILTVIKDLKELGISTIHNFIFGSPEYKKDYDNFILADKIRKISKSARQIAFSYVSMPETPLTKKVESIYGQFPKTINFWKDFDMDNINLKYNPWLNPSTKRIVNSNVDRFNQAYDIRRV